MAKSSINEGSGKELFVQGNIIKTEAGTLVLCTKGHGDRAEHFRGVALASRDIIGFADYKTNWSQRGCKLFQGTIILTEG